MIWRGLGLIAVLLSISAPAIVSAHASIVGCEPPVGSNVPSPPVRIVCQFSEPLDPDQVLMVVVDGDGNRVDLNDSALRLNDETTIAVSLDTAKMDDGLYTVMWRVTNTIDGIETSGEFKFGVNTVVPTAQPPIPPPVPNESTPAPDWGGATNLIARSLIGFGALLLVVMGILIWRSRSSSDAPSSDV